MQGERRHVRVLANRNVLPASTDRSLVSFMQFRRRVRNAGDGLIISSPSHDHEHDHNTWIFVHAFADMGPDDLATFGRDPAVVDHPVRLKNEHPISKEPYEVHEPALLRAFLRFYGGRAPCSV